MKCFNKRASVIIDFILKIILNKNVKSKLLIDIRIIFSIEYKNNYYFNAHFTCGKIKYQWVSGSLKKIIIHIRRRT